MKIIFMGTPDFAVAALDALCRDGQEVILAVTQPDRQKGRGRKVIQTPVKECALKWGVPVFQPARIREPEAVEQIRSLSPDLIVVAAFGQILPQELLDIPRLGCINIHASLLPRLRGAAPIQWSVINGDPESGITLMQMNAGLDTGDILFQESLPIGPQETGESLYEKLAQLGGEMIVKYLPAIAAGEVSPVKQDDSLSTYAPMLRKEMGEIDWSMPAAQIEQRMRGMLPWPGAYRSCIRRSRARNGPVHRQKVHLRGRRFRNPGHSRGSGGGQKAYGDRCFPARDCDRGRNRPGQISGDRPAGSGRSAAGKETGPPDQPGSAAGSAEISRRISADQPWETCCSDFIYRIFILSQQFCNNERAY